MPRLDAPDVAMRPRASETLERERAPTIDASGGQVLVLVLSPDRHTASNPGARAVRRELPRQLAALGGLDVRRIGFPEGSRSPLAGREALVLSAKQDCLWALAEQFAVPKQIDQGRHGTFWQSFSLSQLRHFVGSETPAAFFTESEVLDMLKHGAMAVATEGLEGDCSPEELASLRNARPHHRALRAAESLGVVEAMLAFHNPRKLQELNAMWRPWWPFSPLPQHQLSGYFGPQALHYFVFLRQYGKMLTFPALLGIGTLALHALAESLQGPGVSFTAFSQVSTPIVLVWATIFVEQWKNSLCMTRRKFGLHLDAARAELLVPAAQVGCAAANHGSSAGGGDSEHNDDNSVGWRYFWTISAMCILFATTSVVIHLLLLVGDIVESMSGNVLVQNSPLALYLVVVEVFQRLYCWLATWLTDREGHLMRAEYMKSLTMKKAFFQLINYHGWFLYLAFWRQDLDYLRSQLLVFFTLKQVIGNIMEVVVPKFQASKQFSTDDGTDQASSNRGFLGRSLSRALGSSSNIEKLVEEHFVLPEASSFDDYMEMSVMFAALVLYFPVFPLGGVLALLHAVFECFSDAYKYGAVQRRIIPDEMDDVLVEVWLQIFDVITYFGVCSSFALIWLESKSWTGLQLVIIEHLMFFFKGYLAWSIPDCPEWIEAQEVLSRMQMQELSASHRRSSSVKEGGSSVAPPEMLEVRSVAVQGLQPRWGGLLQRHPVIRLKHGKQTYNTKVEAERRMPSSPSRTASGLQAPDSAMVGSVSASSQDRGQFPESAWDDSFWFSLPLRLGAPLVCEVLSVEHSMFRKNRHVVLGTANFPATMLPTAGSFKAGSFGGGAPVEVTQTLEGSGVMAGASLTLELRCM